MIFLLLLHIYISVFYIEDLLLMTKQALREIAAAQLSFDQKSADGQ